MPLLQNQKPLSKVAIDALKTKLGIRLGLQSWVFPLLAINLMSQSLHFHIHETASSNDNNEELTSNQTQTMVVRME